MSILVVFLRSLFYYYKFSCDLYSNLWLLFMREDEINFSWAKLGCFFSSYLSGIDILVGISFMISCLFVDSTYVEHFLWEFVDFWEKIFNCRSSCAPCSLCRGFLFRSNDSLHWEDIPVLVFIRGRFPVTFTGFLFLRRLSHIFSISSQIFPSHPSLSSILSLL